MFILVKHACRRKSPTSSPYPQGKTDLYQYRPDFLKLRNLCPTMTVTMDLTASRATESSGSAPQLEGCASLGTGRIYPRSHALRGNGLRAAPRRLQSSRKLFPSRPLLESENISKKRVRTMTLMNSFKSLTSKTSSRRSGRRVRRCVPGFAAVGDFAAEILEQRALLSANVTATVASVRGIGSLTLTSDSGDDSVNVYRLDATHIEVDGLNGTTINNDPSAIFALSSVTGITVNLGSGYDQYSIFSQSGDPALNVGKGGVVFVGAGAWSTRTSRSPTSLRTR